MKISRKIGFSLMELMVVLSVMGILMLLLLPAMYRAVEKGKTAECIDHIRQLTLAAILFADEHDGEIPDISPDPAYPEMCLAGSDYIDDDAVYICPSDPRAESAMGDFKTSYTAYEHTPISIKPSYLGGLACEAVIYIESEKAGIATRDNIRVTDIANWHKNATIISFADGHAESFKYGLASSFTSPIANVIAQNEGGSEGGPEGSYVSVPGGGEPPSGKGGHGGPGGGGDGDYADSGGGEGGWDSGDENEFVGAGTNDASGDGASEDSYIGEGSDGGDEDEYIGDDTERTPIDEDDPTDTAPYGRRPEVRKPLDRSYLRIGQEYAGGSSDGIPPR